MADQTLQVLGSKSNVQFAFAPTDADGNPTKFDPATPVSYDVTGGTIDQATGLWTIPADFKSDSATLTGTAAYKDLKYVVDVTGLDADVANLVGSATVVPK